MSTIISIHSYRGGTGKSNTTANIAAVLASNGMRVGIIDTDILSPGVHVLFGLKEDDITRSLNDYLWGKCNIEEAAQDVTARAGAGMTGAGIRGKLYLVPSSMKASDIAKVLREGYDVGLLNDGYQRLLKELKLDVLMIDTHPGLNEETLLSIAISDSLAIILRPDSQDYQGTAVTVSVARKLDVPKLMLIVNKAPPVLNLADVKKRVEASYGCEVAAVFPHSDEMMTLASEGIFAMRYPNHPFTDLVKTAAAKLAG
jgi:MinD-like ATPase involved in chromosome partitioning or flagellar assembly